MNSIEMRLNHIEHRSWAFIWALPIVRVMDVMFMLRSMGILKEKDMMLMPL